MVSIKERNMPKSGVDDGFSTDVEENEVDPVVLEAVKRLLQLLNNTLKSLLIYPKNNPLPKEFKKKLYLSLSEFLDTYDELKLEVEPGLLSYEGKTVYEDGEREEGIAYLLHQDGVRELAFIKGLDQGEIDDFIEVMETELSIRELEEDLVTMLWEKDFNHIKYLVVDDLLDVQVPSADEIPDSWDFHRLFSSEVAVAQPKTEADLEADSQKRQRQTKELLQKLKEYSEEEIENIQKLLELDDGRQSLDEFFDILTEIWMVETDAAEFNLMMEAVEKILNALINVADFSSAAKVLNWLRKFEEMMAQSDASRNSLKAEKRKRTRKAMDQAGEEGRIEKITQILNDKENVDLAAVRTYLFSLNWNSVSPILHMLRELKEFQARRMVCDLLAAQGQDKLEIIKEGLSDQHWFVVRNVIWVMGNIGSAEGVRYLKPLIHHPDLRIRKEIITSLIKIPGPEAGAALTLFLEDNDQRIRSLSCKGLTKRREKGALAVLMKLLKETEFRDRSPDEKKSLLESYASIGGNEAIPLLSKMINKRSWLKRDKHNETRIFAIGALGLIDSDQAKETLISLSRKRNKILRKTCGDTLRRMELRHARGREAIPLLLPDRIPKENN
jgi:HEAT repeat protein